MPGLFDDLRKLPAVVREHLYSEELERWYADAHDRWGLPDDQRPEVEGAALDVYLRKRTLDQFVERLRELVGDEAKSKAIAIEILGNDFLKIEDYLGVNIPAYIKALGGDPSKFVKEIPVADVVAGVMKGIGVAPSDPVIVKRMEHAVTVFLTGVRDALETKDVLTRATKVGGVGLDAATADRIVQALTAQLKELRDAGVIVRTETVKPPETSTFHLVKPGKSSVMQPEDEAEIEQIRRKVAPGDVAGEKIRAAVDRVIQKTGAKFKNEDVTRRFRTAVESRIRDIRDHQETLDLFTRPSAAGGFGIPKEQAEKVLRVIEEEVRVVHGTARRMATDRYGSPRITDVRGESTTAAPPAPQAASLSPAPTTPVLPSPPPVATLVHPVPPTPQVASRQAGGQAPPVPSAPTAPATVPPAPAKPVPSSPPRGIATSLPSVAPRNDIPLVVAAPPVVKQIPIAPPPLKQVPAAPLPSAAPKPPLTPPPSPMSSPLRAGASEPEASRGEGEKKKETLPMSPSVIREHPSTIRAPSVASAKPKMQDIRPVAPRLVGPIEELQQLTLQDFRKIAKAPADAATRIVEKLALLEKDSFTKRAEGVKALRGSPLMAVYAEVLGAALVAKRKAEEEVKERLAKDKSALTVEEFQALGWLNQQLRF